MASYGGSHLYGLNTPESDIDIRGICFSPVESLLGLTGFEQYQPGKEEARTFSYATFRVDSNDVTIYALNKFLKLCLDANPNILELLFSRHLLVDSNVWNEIVSKRHLFLSTKIVHTFAGYAYSQLQRIEGHKRWLDNPPTKPNPYEFGMVQNNKGGQDWTSTNYKNAYENKLKEHQDYQIWFDNRNEYRHGLELKFGYDVKHAMHLFRLLLEAKELLLTGSLELPLKKEHQEFLLNIKNGYLPYDEVVKAGREAKDRLLEFEKVSVLPKSPQRDEVEDLLINLNAAELECG